MLGTQGVPKNVFSKYNTMILFLTSLVPIPKPQNQWTRAVIIITPTPTTKPLTFNHEGDEEVLIG